MVVRSETNSLPLGLTSTSKNVPMVSATKTSLAVVPVVGGLRQSTIDGLAQLKEECGCDLTVTGGSELGHSEGSFSHGAGYKADLRLTPELNNYIESNYERVGTRSDGAALYRDPDGNTYARESTHWDITYR